WKKAPVGDKGHLWYRAKVAVPAEWQGRKLELVVEAIDDAREFYVSGQFVGRLGEFPPSYRSALGETQRLAVPGSSSVWQRQRRRDPRLQYRGAHRLQCGRPGTLCRRRGHSLAGQMGDGQWRRRCLGQCGRSSDQSDCVQQGGVGGG